MGEPEAAIRVEIYRLDTDAGERHDLADRERARVVSMLGSLRTFLAGQREARRRFLAAHEQRLESVATPSRELLDRLRSLGYVR
jgi:hypothetical protein